ncbi:MAG: glycosyltransferase [Clostridiales bacterium]|nr:glycosyltransferase [Clostridiales bacterium]
MEHNNQDKKQKCNILIVHNRYKIAGGEDSVVQNEAALLRKHGHKVTLYLRSNEELEQYNTVQKILFPFQAVFSIRSYREIRNILHKEQINIVHVHNTLSVISPSVYYAARKEGIPIVQTVHNFRLVCPGALLVRENTICKECIEKGLGCAVKHNCYRGSKIQSLVSAMILWIHRKTGIYKHLHYICLTDFTRQLLMQADPRIFDIRRMYVKPNFVDIPKTENIVPFNEREQSYAYIGRLDEAKGIRVLLKAWQLLPERRLYIAGSGPLQEEISLLIQQEQRKNIVFLGAIAHDKVYELMGKIRALILPTQWYEGFPMTIVEAYSCGTPVIGSKLGNVEATVQDGKTGVLFEHHNPQALVDAVYRLEQMDGRKMQENIRQIYCDQYTGAVNYRQLTDIYEKIILSCQS